MTKKEKEILFKSTQEAWNGTQLFKNDKDESGQNIYRMYRSEFGALYELCDKLGIRKEWIDYSVIHRNEFTEVYNRCNKLGT